MTDAQHIELLLEAIYGIADRNMGGRPNGTKMAIDCINLKECVRQLAELANPKKENTMIGEKEAEEKKECCGAEKPCDSTPKTEEAGNGTPDTTEKKEEPKGE